MKLRAAVATGMSTAVFGAYLLLSDAPPRVHAVTAAAFLVAFWVPAMFVHEPADLWARKYLLLALVLIGVATFDIGLSATLSKKELLDAPMLFIIGAPAMVGLLAVHGAIVRRTSRATAV